MKTAIALLVATLSSVAAVGCSADTGEDASAANSAFSCDGCPERLDATATVVTAHVVQSGACTVDVKVPVITTKDQAVTKVFAAMFPTDASQFCGDLEAGEKVDVEGTFNVTYNYAGMLSLTVAQSSSMEGAAHPSHTQRAYTLDLKTGKEIPLTDLLQAPGIAALGAACRAYLTADGFYDGDQAAQVCADAVAPDGSPQFVINNSGVRLFMDLSGAAFALGAEGVFVPWLQLGGRIR